ncbi:HU family DNA-binding protein [Candidatus Methylacidithermus pantelleriae]|jgi:DNA-binding protein HU-beta|uniref:DNA-binding protein HU-alpha n=1 Tax=Candidatus Methylacidithermus pantelleriae TaxID=2744239 RepID=A0A8J2BLE3_9BACT|nr:HU family DNA-binding protein [Candidatus Methylacidithermus pantelleriae]CAF0696118.1 DNA-binding protein HU-alpha [Candidatus Methylacidithermus pantelleriae]
MSLSRAGLVELVQKTLGKDTTKVAAERAVNAVIQALKTGIKKSGRVQLIGFGTFKVVTRKARTGVNPKTGEKIKIKASKTVRFIPGSDLRKGL